MKNKKLLMGLIIPSVVLCAATPIVVNASMQQTKETTQVVKQADAVADSSTPSTPADKAPEQQNEEPTIANKNDNLDDLTFGLLISFGVAVPVVLLIYEIIWFYALKPRIKRKQEELDRLEELR